MTIVDRVKNGLGESLAALYAQFIEYLPSIVGALLVLCAGYVAALVLRRLSSSILRRMGLDRILKRAGMPALLARARVGRSPSQLIGQVLFWLAMLLAAISATETLGLERASAAVGVLVTYLPNVLAAAGIALGGIILGRAVREFLEETTSSLGLQNALVLSRVVNGLVVIVASSLALSQLGIKTGLLNRFVEAGLLAVLGAGALACGLGSRELARNILAGIYARDLIEPDTTVAVEGRSGVLESVGTVVTRIRAEDGRIFQVPNQKLTETNLVIHERA